MIRNVFAVYFSPAGHTKLVTVQIAAMLAERLPAPAGRLSVPLHFADFTLPEARTAVRRFGPDDLVVFGCPTYAGRVPNKILPSVRELFFADGTPAVAAVTFGNRDFDSSLAELQGELLKNGFRVFAAGAFPCRHVFSDTLGAGRPDEADLRAIAHFAAMACEKLAAGGALSEDGPDGSAPRLELSAPVIRGGEAVGPYYVPKGTDGQPASFLKAKPETDPERCDRCGLCARVCPMGSVTAGDPPETPGVCIKCHACIRRCPRGARRLADPAFLAHVAMLERDFAARKDAEVFL